MKSNVQSFRRALPLTIIATLSIAIGFITTHNNPLLSEASAVSTTLQVTVENEIVIPEVTGVTPDHGSSMGGTTLVITGNNLDKVTSIKVGEAECKPISIISPEEVTCVTSAHVAGKVNVVVASDSGSVLLENAFTYQPFLPLPPPTGGSESGLGAPGTGLYLFGTADSVTYNDIIFISFIVIVALGATLFLICEEKKKRNKSNKTAKKSTPRKKVTKKSRK